MAVSANTVWELRTTGAITNGGGFVTGASGTDYSQQDSAQYALTGVTSSGAGNTVLTASAAAAMVGNIAYAVSGTNLRVGFYEVTSVVVGVSITFSTNSAGTSIASGAMASGVINIGGAQLSPGLVAATLAATNKVWMKAGSYTIDSGSVNTATGWVQIPSGITNVTWRGYNASRGDNPGIGSRPLLQASGGITTNVLLAANQNGSQVSFMAFDGAGKAAVAGLQVTVGVAFACNGSNFTQNAFRLNEEYRCVMIGCVATSCTGGATVGAFAGGGSAFYCEAYSNACAGFNFTAGTSRAVGCLSWNNTGGTYDGFKTSNGAMFDRCVSAGNAGAGFTVAGTGGFAVCSLLNCVAVNNTGVAAALSANNVFVQTFARYNNGGGITGSAVPNLIINEIVLTADPFVNTASGDFTPNLATGGGLLLRGLGFPTSYVNSLNYLDIGAVQAQGYGTAFATGVGSFG